MESKNFENHFDSAKSCYLTKNDNIYDQEMNENKNNELELIVISYKTLKKNQQLLGMTELDYQHNFVGKSKQ